MFAGGGVGGGEAGIGLELLRDAAGQGDLDGAHDAVGIALGVLWVHLPEREIVQGAQALLVLHEVVPRQGQSQSVPAQFFHGAREVLEEAFGEDGSV